MHKPARYDFVVPPSSVERLSSLLRDAIALDRACKGNIQVFDPMNKTLKFVVQEGFDAHFLSHFNVVRLADGTPCARACGRQEPLFIPDVLADDELKRHAEVFLRGGFRSVKSVPTIGSDKCVYGILSTHSTEVRWDWELENTRHIAEEVAAVLVSAPELWRPE